MVKKIYIILTILIFSTFVFSACSAQTMIESRLKELNEIIPEDEARVNETFDNMAEAIANKDEDELKALFSETALKEADGFEEDTVKRLVKYIKNR